MRLRRASPSDEDCSRRRKGDGWVFLGVDGMPSTDGVGTARCRELAVPPAWRNGWICRHANGHLPALGRGERAVLELLG